MRTPQNRQWLEAVKKAKGKAQPAKKKEDDEEVVLFPESKPFWDLFSALNRQRQMGANGPQAFSVTDIYNAAIMLSDFIFRSPSSFAVLFPGSTDRRLCLEYTGIYLRRQASVYNLSNVPVLRGEPVECVSIWSSAPESP